MTIPKEKFVIRSPAEKESIERWGYSVIPAKMVGLYNPEGCCPWDAQETMSNLLAFDVYCISSESGYTGRHNAFAVFQLPIGYTIEQMTKLKEEMTIEYRGKNMLMFGTIWYRDGSWEEADDTDDTGSYAVWRHHALAPKPNTEFKVQYTDGTVAGILCMPVSK